MLGFGLFLNVHNNDFYLVFPVQLVLLIAVFGPFSGYLYKKNVFGAICLYK